MDVYLLRSISVSSSGSETLMLIKTIIDFFSCSFRIFFCSISCLFFMISVRMTNEEFNAMLTSFDTRVIFT